MATNKGFSDRRSEKIRVAELDWDYAVSLARLWQSQGKKAEAHQILTEIYDWFTEGFDTPDLREAKALLDELA